MAGKMKLELSRLQETVGVYVNNVNTQVLDLMGDICRSVQAMDDNNPISEQTLEQGKALEKAYNNFLNGGAKTAKDGLEQFIDLSEFHASAAQVAEVTSTNTEFDARKVDVSKATRVQL